MISTRDISSYLSCKRNYLSLAGMDYTGLILERLKQRCPKLKPNRAWVKHYCDELNSRAKLYLDTLNKLSITDLKAIANSLNINFGWLGGAGPSKNYFITMIFDELMKCKNYETIFGESITEIDPKKMCKTKNNYCHNIDELLAYLISTKDSNLEPKDENNVEELWVNAQQKQAFLKNKFHDSQSLKQYHQMVRFKTQQKQRSMTLELFKYIEFVGKLGFILISDEPNSHAVGGFDNSMKAIISFTKLLDQSPPGVKDQILQLANFNSDSVSQLFSKINTTCIHGSGSALIGIYFYHFQNFKKKYPQLELLPLFQKNDENYVSIQFSGGMKYINAVKKAKAKDPVYRNYYAPNNIGKIIRLHRDFGYQLTANDLKEMRKLVKEFAL